MVNHLFFPREGYLLEELKKIPPIPCWIAQGRYDIICPVISALELSRIMPGSKLNIVPDAGHSISEPGLVDCLIRGIEDLSEHCDVTNTIFLHLIIIKIYKGQNYAEKNQKEEELSKWRKYLAIIIVALYRDHYHILIVKEPGTNL
jgi:hypothetical protein